MKGCISNVYVTASRNRNKRWLHSMRRIPSAATIPTNSTPTMVHLLNLPLSIVVIPITFFPRMRTRTVEILRMWWWHVGCRTGVVRLPITTCRSAHLIWVIALCLGLRRSPCIVCIWYRSPLVYIMRICNVAPVHPRAAIVILWPRARSLRNRLRKGCGWRSARWAVLPWSSSYVILGGG